MISKANAQLKAFLIPARDETEGQHIHLYYDETHKFHFEQLKRRQGELEALVGKVLGPEVKVHLHGPNEGRDRKKR